MTDSAVCEAEEKISLATNNQLLQHRQPRGGGKRKRFDDSPEDLQEKLSNFQYSPHYLRIPASSVSALCGLHPFQNLPQLLYDFVYQSYFGQLLLKADAQALGLTLVDARIHERETMLGLASAASKEAKELVKKVLEVSEGKRKLQSIDEVQSIQKQIKAQAAKAEASGKLTKNQVESLMEASRGHVSTGFGTCHEDEALDEYEKRTGCCVRERNEALMEWRFQRICDVNSELGVTAVSMGGAKRKVWGQIHEQILNDDDKKEEAVKTTRDGTEAKPIEIDDNAQYDGQGNINEIKAEAPKKIPFFRIVGAVDGIRDELYVEPSTTSALKTSFSVPPANAASTTSTNPSDSLHNSTNNNSQHKNTYEYNFSDDEADQWSLRPIIVECKHRMKEAKVPPPLYDQIQTCLYCHMYCVEEADLIQVVRRKGKKCEEKENDALQKNGGDGEKSNRKSKMKGARSNKEDMKITVTRVSLNDPVHNHNHHWEATLLPRLASFVDAVYNVRKDDGKRYRLLMAMVQSQQEGSKGVSDEEPWKLLWEECPWLAHCDTAFSFGKRRR
ncbi:hypothetical protein ACHAXR_010624 [Thalassiosira sp. AJA248-18]